MRIAKCILTGSAALALMLTLTTSAHAHASYNITGYGSGLGGSTNGADGMPGAGAGTTWTNGDPVAAEYTGKLPVMWYSGMHSATQIRTIQTGAGANPPNGSLLQQINAYNTANDPDLPVDRVLAVGGKSWSDPDNGNQGWGHGLDFGLIHYSPLGDILAGGPVKFTVSLQDDPADGVAPRFAMAVYGHWDDSATASRHQTFTSDPAPGNGPLGATSLMLLGYAVATSSGGPVSLTFDLDDSYGGEYTVIVGALGGVAGQYFLTVSTAPDGVLGECMADLDAIGACPDDLNQCEADVATCEAEIADADGDGVPDLMDACAGTLASTPVDLAGCSQAQFCTAVPATTPKIGKKLCQRADWKNDEPLMKLGARKGQQDCVFVKNGKGTLDDQCAPLVVTP